MSIFSPDKVLVDLADEIGMQVDLSDCGIYCQRMGELDFGEPAVISVTHDDGDVTLHFLDDVPLIVAGDRITSDQVFWEYMNK